MEVAFISLGCNKNLVDSEAMLGYFTSTGWIINNNIVEADLVVINTCGFIQSAKEEAIKVIFDVIAQKRQDAKVVVTGCLAERYKENIGELIEEVDLFIPITSYNEFDSLIKKLFNQTDKKNIHDKLSFLNRKTVSTYHSYVKIAEGCNNCCTYCAIPLIRGKLKSRGMEEIIQEVQGLIINGAREITLVSQDTSQYGLDIYGKTSLVELLSKLVVIPNLFILRILYLYPDEVDDDLIDFIKNNNVITPYFDIPIQHCNDNILKAMNRRGKKEYLRELFKKIRNKIPKATLRTTLIVGFPGEDEKEYNELKEFIQEIAFDRLGVFCYSKEEDTKAYNYTKSVSKTIALQRQKELMEIQEKISHQQGKKYINEVTLAVIEEKNESYYLARGYMNAPDNIDGMILIKKEKDYQIGELVTVRIKSAYIHDLYGEIID